MHKRKPAQTPEPEANINLTKTLATKDQQPLKAGFKGVLPIILLLGAAFGLSGRGKKKEAPALNGPEPTKTKPKNKKGNKGKSKKKAVPTIQL